MKTQLVRGAAVLALVAVGTFLGAWSWDSFKQWKAELAEAEKFAAAEAEKKSPRGIQREAVRKRMHDPDSAEFKNDSPAKRGKDIWCGEVNGRNRMGGKVGFTRYVAYIYPDREADVLDQVNFDVIDPISDSGKLDAAAFRGKWSAHCE